MPLRVAHGGEAPVHRLLALYARGMNDHPMTTAAAQAHAREVVQSLPALRALHMRWNGGADIPNPHKHLTWVGMKTLHFPE
jgi:hypothetical protein